MINIEINYIQDKGEHSPSDHLRQSLSDFLQLCLESLKQSSALFILEIQNTKYEIRNICSPSNIPRK